MTDLTVLVSPIPLYPAPRAPLPFGRRTPRPASRPIMVTLESEIDPAEAAADRPHTPTPTADSEGDFIDPPAERIRRARSPRVVEPHLLSPPVNTWKSRPRHRPTRSQSAPPERRSPEPAPVSEEGQPQPEEERERNPYSFDTERLGFARRNPNRSFTAFARADRHAPTTRGGELVRPPPPLRVSFFSIYKMTICLMSNWQSVPQPSGARRVAPASLVPRTRLPRISSAARRTSPPALRSTRPCTISARSALRAVSGSLSSLPSTRRFYSIFFPCSYPSHPHPTNQPTIHPSNKNLPPRIYTHLCSCFLICFASLLLLLWCLETSIPTSVSADPICGAVKRRRHTISGGPTHLQRTTDRQQR